MVLNCILSKEQSSNTKHPILHRVRTISIFEWTSKHYYSFGLIIKNLIINQEIKISENKEEARIFIAKTDD